MKTYSYGKDELQALDIYIPAKPNQKSLILIHGGGWWQGDKSKEVKIAQNLAGVGYYVAAVNYRLVKDGRENLFPTQDDDVKLAYEWLITNQKEFTKDNIAFVGGSTGGHLAAYLGLTIGRPFVSLSGLFDIKGFYDQHPDTKPHILAIKKDTPSNEIDQDGTNDPYYKWIIENMLSDVSAQSLADASIYRYVSKNSGPGFLVNSLNEIVPPNEQQKLANQMVEVGVPVQTITLRGPWHATAYYPEVQNDIYDFLERYI